MPRPLQVTTLAEAIENGDLSSDACDGKLERGVWSHACPHCGHRKPASALVDCRDYPSAPAEFLCDNCWTQAERVHEVRAEGQPSVSRRRAKAAPPWEGVFAEVEIVGRKMVPLPGSVPEPEPEIEHEPEDQEPVAES